MKMVDISGKEDIPRMAIAEGCLVFEDIKERKMLDAALSLGRFTAIMTTKLAWRYMPFLHPIAITHIKTEYQKIDDNVLKLMTTAKTVAKTGVEMDVLFGTLMGLIASWAYLKMTTRASIMIKGIRVVAKKKGISEEKATRSGLNEVSIPVLNLSPRKPEERQSIVEGFIRLKPATLELIAKGAVEKGDVVKVSRAVAVYMAKQADDLVPFIVDITVHHVEPYLELKKRGVRARVMVQGRGRGDVIIAALISLGSLLLNVWDMVKPYEKDKRGLYPYTEIEYMREVL